LPWINALAYFVSLSVTKQKKRFTTLIQEARGRLERQRILDDAEAEKAKRELLTLQAESAAVESTGQAKAEALSRAEANKIEAEMAVQVSTS